MKKEDYLERRKEMIQEIDQLQSKLHNELEQMKIDFLNANVEFELGEFVYAKYSGDKELYEITRINVNDYFHAQFSVGGFMEGEPLVPFSQLMASRIEMEGWYPYIGYYAQRILKSGKLSVRHAQIINPVKIEDESIILRWKYKKQNK